MAKFLKGIDLMEDEEVNMSETKKKEQVLQYTIDFDEEKHLSEWSALYHALENVEKLCSLANQDTSRGVFSNQHNSANLVPNLLLIGLHHKVYWIRLAVQRVFGALFSLSMNLNISIDKVLGL